MHKISVIVPCYNVADYVGNCIDHLIDQTIGLENLEIILVDDASTDNGATLSVLMEYERQYPENIMVIPLEENLRQGGARNVGIYYASGEYIAFCDADDWYVKEAFQRLYTLAKTSDSDVVEYEYYKVFSLNEEPQEKSVASDDSGGVLVMDSEVQKREYLVTEYTFNASWNKIYRAALLKENHIYFPEHVFWEEGLFCYLLRFYVKRHFFLNEKLYCYYQRPGSTMNGSYEPKKYDNMVSFELLYEETVNRGLWSDYKEEIQYLFWYGYFYTTLITAAKHKIFVEREDFLAMQRKVMEVVPDIAGNKYFQRVPYIPAGLADVTYCDGSSVEMADLYHVFRTMYCQLYGEKD